MTQVWHKYDTNLRRSLLGDRLDFYFVKFNNHKRMMAYDYWLFIRSF